MQIQPQIVTFIWKFMKSARVSHYEYLSQAPNNLATALITSLLSAIQK